MLDEQNTEYHETTSYLDPGGALLVLLDQLVVQLALARGHAQLLHQAGLRRQVSQYLDNDV